MTGASDGAAVALFPHDLGQRKDEEEIHNRNDLRCVNRRGGGPPADRRKRQTAGTVNVRN